MWRVESYGSFVGGFGANNASISGDFELEAICAKLTGGATQSLQHPTGHERYAADLREMQQGHDH